MVFRPALLTPLLLLALAVHRLTADLSPQDRLSMNKTEEFPLPSSFLPLKESVRPISDHNYYAMGDSSSDEDSKTGAQGIHLLLRPPDLLSPSIPPPLPPYGQPTITPPHPSLEHGPSLEETWGSGDYVETLSFVVPEGDDLVLATPMPSQPYDDDDDDGTDHWVSYNTALPKRPTLPLVSRLSPSFSTPTIDLHTGPDLFPTWDDDYDPDDMMPLEPTELLLPDMNSLEYYTNLLAREREREREWGREHTVTKPSISPTATQSPTHIPPTPLPSSPVSTEVSKPTPPLTLSPTVTSTVKPSAAPTPPPKVKDFTPISVKPPPPPPPNTTTQAPPKSSPSYPKKPDRPSVITEKPTTTTLASTTKTTLATTTKSIAKTTQRTVVSFTRTPQVSTPRISPPTRQYLCNITKPEMFLVRIVSSKGSSASFSPVRELLKREFNRSVELQFLRTPSSFAFRVVSGPLIYTAMSVINALRQTGRGFGPIPTVSPLFTVPDLVYQIHTILQFVPSHIDVRVCNFSQRVEKGLLMAFAESRRRAHENTNISIQLLNITTGLKRLEKQQKAPVDITFAVKDGRGYLTGSEVSEHLRKLSQVEFSFYIGFPALQIAELLLGVQDQQVAERSFKARLERRLALLLEEGLSGVSRRRWRRATAVANNSLQVVRVAKLSGAERPLEVLYFVEGPGGVRIPAEVTAATLNRLDLQRAAIIIGHRVQRPLAQSVEMLTVPPAETQASSIWLIVGVVVPVILAVFIIIILYWKLCGSDKLEFQPDAINTIQQRQKLQAPSVKGFDFAKLHLGQHSKDDIMVIQEPGSLPAPVKEPTPSDGTDLNTPKSKGSSTKVARSTRRRGRMSPSDGDSLGSDQSSGRESAEESTRPVATPVEGKQQKKPKSGRNKIGSGPDELLSSSSIFDHVDRVSKGSSECARRPANKVQLIAMQPRPSPSSQHTPAPHSPTHAEKVALRQKSEIEHHRHKLRQRVKRRGQCEFPSMDDIMDAFGDGPVQSEAAQRLYSSAHDHMDCILQPDTPSPPTPSDSRKRGRRSPRGHRPHQGPGSLPDTDRDRLLMDHGSATYRKYPGLNNVAYMSDPDLPQDHGSPSPTDEVFDSAPPPPPYLPPQPSIEEARQQMHSLLDDAFALVSPSSQSSAGVSGLSPALPCPSPQVRRPGRQWGSYPAAPTHSPFSARYAELGMSPTSIQGLLQNQIGAYPGVGRSMSGPTGSSWIQQHSDQELSRPGASRESVLSFPEFSSSSVFQMPSSSLRDSHAPPLLLTSPTPEYPPDDASPSAHTSASLIKAIREELRRLAQKQTAVTSYP
uniref:Uncharacterized protein n=1 Tax=Knipowitschia caucasica TaxID=637954 RepID=A0AAV2ISS3_KNICA